MPDRVTATVVPDIHRTSARRPPTTTKAPQPRLRMELGSSPPSMRFPFCASESCKLPSSPFLRWVLARSHALLSLAQATAAATLSVSGALRLMLPSLVTCRLPHPERPSPEVEEEKPGLPQQRDTHR